MYNVIVVDDETWICKLIRKIVDWDTIGFNIVANASDGLTALNLIREHKPDLVITDIRMPGLDGIGLIKAVREQELDVEFVIISGYSDFEYARSALTLDAFAYILKPLDKEEFEEILYSVKDKISKKYRIQNKLESSDTVMLEGDMRKIIDKTNKDISLDTLNSRYGTNFTDGIFYTAILKRDYILKENTNDERYMQILTDVKKTYAGCFQEMVHFPGKTKDQTVVLINVKKETDDLKRVMKEVIKAFESERELQRSSVLTISIGSGVRQISDIDVSYESALNAMKARVFLGAGKVIDAKNEAGRLSDVKDIIDIRVRKKLALLLDVFNIDDALDEITKILSDAEKRCADNLIAYHIAAYEIIDLLFASMQKKGIQFKNGFEKQHAIQCVDDFRFKSDIENFIIQLVKKCNEMHLDEKHENGEKLIIEIKRFISENYMSNINLDDIAKLVCLSPTYVSEVFKRKTGENFSEYLIDYRIEIAKDVLKDIRYKVVDVSLMVGYRDSKYFSRLFKKKVGVNPSDYRKLYF